MKSRNHSKIFISHTILIRFSFIVLLLHQQKLFVVGVTSSRQISTDHTCDEFNLGKRMSEIEAKNQNQEDEIGILKTLRVEDQKVINQLRDRVEKLETAAAERILERQKRPFRLAPVNFYRGKQNDPINEGEAEQHTDINKFYGPATNCNELGMLGYTLNGFYIVKGKNSAQSESSSKKIEVVYCQFHHQPHHRGTKEVIEDRLGQLDVKSGSGIYFYVQRKGNLINSDDDIGVIKFNTDRLNIGKAMNLSTSVFTAPKAGIYHFSCAILKDGYTFSDVYVYLRINGIKNSVSQIGRGPIAAPMSIQSTLKLKKGDRVDLWKPSSGGLASHIDSPLHHFTGWLLEALE